MAASMVAQLNVTTMHGHYEPPQRIHTSTRASALVRGVRKRHGLHTMAGWREARAAHARDAVSGSEEAELWG